MAKHLTRLLMASAALLPASAAFGQSTDQPVFRVPLTMVEPESTLPPVYMWTEMVGACSTTCGTGTRAVTHACQDAMQMDASGGFGPAEPAAQCVAAVGPAPANSNPACTNYSACTFDWVKPAEVVTASPGRPGCGTTTRTFSPFCRRSDGTVMSDADHRFCRNDLPDYTDVAAGDADALGYDRTALETNLCNASDHSWEASPTWTSWSSTCSSTAVRTRSVVCKRTMDDTAVADSNCDASTKPATSETSGVYGGCSYSAANWTAYGAWASGCSSSTTRTRTASCRRSDGSIVADSECTSRSIALSQTETGSNYASCSYTAEFTPWSAWSSTCSSSATRTRSASCRRSNGDNVPNTECTSRGVALTPTSETSAQYGGCTYAAQFGAWSGWSSSCSSTAIRTRSASCRRSDGTIVPDADCTSRSIALTPTSETSGQYGGCTYAAGGTPSGWSAWASGCSSSTTRTRTYQCVRSDGTIVPNTECSNRGVNLVETGSGANYASCSYSAQFSAWSAWSSSCSTAAVRTRSASCLRSDGTYVPDAECTSRSISLSPTSETSGQYGGCTYAAGGTPSAWSAWASGCSSNTTRTRTYQCVRSDGTIVPNTECSNRGVNLVETGSGANYASCSYSAQFSAWSAWSSTCSNTAVRTRTASCLRSDGTYVAASECTNRGVAMTPTSETSGQYGGCTYEASYGTWSSCSTGSKARSVTCYRSDGAQVSTTYCGGTGATQEGASCTSLDDLYGHSYRTIWFGLNNDGRTEEMKVTATTTGGVSNYSWSSTTLYGSPTVSYSGNTATLSVSKYEPNSGQSGGPYDVRGSVTLTLTVTGTDGTVTTRSETFTWGM